MSSTTRLMATLAATSATCGGSRRKCCWRLSLWGFISAAAHDVRATLWFLDRLSSCGDGFHTVDATVQHRRAGGGNRCNFRCMVPETAAVTHLAAESPDSHLTIRRVERQQRLVELLGAVQEPVSSAVLAQQLGVGLRTVERDLARLRESGVPIESVPGPHGGSKLPRNAAPDSVRLSFEEIAALIASLAALGPTSTRSSDSAMRAPCASNRTLS
jgi:biotin operon repressor